MISLFLGLAVILFSLIFPRAYHAFYILKIRIEYKKIYGIKYIEQRSDDERSAIYRKFVNVAFWKLLPLYIAFFQIDSWFPLDDLNYYSDAIILYHLLGRCFGFYLSFNFNRLRFVNHKEEILNLLEEAEMEDTIDEDDDILGPVFQE